MSIWDRDLSRLLFLSSEGMSALWMSSQSGTQTHSMHVCLSSSTESTLSLADNTWTAFDRRLGTSTLASYTERVGTKDSAGLVLPDWTSYGWQVSSQDNQLNRIAKANRQQLQEAFRRSSTSCFADSACSHSDARLVEVLLKNISAWQITCSSE
jgi:hypothetical protein